MATENAKGFVLAFVLIFAALVNGFYYLLVSFLYQTVLRGAGDSSRAGKP